MSATKLFGTIAWPVAADVPLELNRLVEPSVRLVEQMMHGGLEGVVVKKSDVVLP